MVSSTHHARKRKDLGLEVLVAPKADRFLEVASVARPAAQLGSRFKESVQKQMKYPKKTSSTYSEAKTGPYKPLFELATTVMPQVKFLCAPMVTPSAATPPSW